MLGHDPFLKSSFVHMFYLFMNLYNYLTVGDFISKPDMIFVLFGEILMPG
jgi:hypothetical protein